MSSTLGYIQASSQQVTLFLSIISWGNPDQDIEGQINGAIDHLEERLKSIGETLDCLVQVDCLFKDIWQIPVMEKVFHERFKGNYPTRKSIQTAFAHNGGVHGLLFQMDAIGVRD